MPALQPVPGSPGEFIDADGNKIRIVEYREDTKYDTIEVAAGLMAAGTQFTFFRDLAGKNPIDSNFTTPRRLPSGEKMVLTHIGVYVRLCAGNVIPTPADLKRVYENAYYVLRVNQLLVAEGPAIMFPAGFGLYGQTTENNSGVISNGVPSRAAQTPLRQPQLLTENHDINGMLNFDGRIGWVTAVGAGGTIVMPTTIADMLVTATLHGLVSSAATK